jgi:adenosylhomocysteine nucleosidase
MNILITYAVEAEFAPWRALRDLQKVTVGGVEVHRAQVGRAMVDFLVTGMGSAHAQFAADAVISKEYSFCIAAGFAGALKPSVQLGDVVAAKKVVNDGPGGTSLSARNLWSRASKDGAKRIETLLTTDHVVNTVEEKARLAPFGEAVDMESFAILTVARSKKVPAVAIRVISDAFDRDWPANIDTMMDGKGNVRIGAVVRYVANNPLAVPALLRLGRDSRTVAHALANFLEAYIKKISFSTHGWPPIELQEVAGV